MDEPERPYETAETTSPTLGERRRRVLGRVGVIVLWIAGIFLSLAALAVVALAALIAHGPVEVETAARTAEALLAEAAGPGGVAKVANARLDWSWDEGLTVDLERITAERAGVVAVTIPRAEVSLRLSPLLTGHVRARALVLIEPQVAIDMAGLASAGGAGAAVAAGVAAVAMPTEPPSNANAPPPGETAAAAVAPRPTRAIAEAREIGRVVDRALARARADGIERFGLRRGTVELRRVDSRGEPRLVVRPEIEGEAVVDGPAGDLDVGFSARGEISRWSMRLTAAKDGDGRRLTFVADDVTHRDLFGPPGPTFDLGMPLYPRLTLRYGDDDRYDGAEIDVRLGAGEFRFGGMPEDTMLVDEGQIQIEWKAGADELDVRNLYLAVGETGMTLHGRILAPKRRNGVWDIALDADTGSFRPRDVAGKPLTVDGGHLRARLDPATKIVDITEGQAAFGSGWVKTAGRIDFSADEPKLKMDLSFSALDVEQVKRIWPHWVAPDAREWFIRNVSAGRLLDTMIQLDLPRFDKQETWPGNAMRMTARFEEAKFRILGNLPAATAAAGRLTIDERRMDLIVDRAQVATRAAKRPNLEVFRFSVADIFVKPPKATIKVRVTGEVAALAEVVDAEPLALLDEAGITRDGLAGTAAVDAQIGILFEPKIRASSIDYKIDATLDRFASPNPIQGRKFQDGRFRIVADPRGMKITGRAQIDGVVADVDMYEPRVAGKGAEKRDFKMMLDEAARQRLGLDLGELVRGAIVVAVAQPNQAEARRKVDVDLTQARLELAPFGWSKGAGVPARAQLDLVEDDKGVRLENLTVESEGLAIAGSVQLDKDHKIVSADFGRFALRKGDAAKLKVARAADQTLAVTFEAQSFDVRSVLQSGRRGGPEDDPRPASAKPTDLVLKLRAARLVGFNDVALADAALDARYRGGAFATLQFSARSSGGRSLSASIKPEGDKRAITVNADDAGAVLSFLDFFDRIRGGRLIMAAKASAPGMVQGRVRLEAFDLLEQPKSARAAPQSTADGVRQIKVRRVEINPQTDFSKATVAFSMRDGVVTVTEGVAKGNTVGATASGQLDLNNQRISLSGTYIPAFGLNNLAGRIPVFGAITGAGSDGGLVGVTFRVFGGLEDPILEVNPLSAIAPGIFRRIFEFQRDERPAPAPTGNAPTRITP
ncbi:MAG: DUF3971 domain-containing protein [Siculibacillus sp.]|nr:DUF3971 domain-containing protein [Siculibacillus sp.]